MRPSTRLNTYVARRLSTAKALRALEPTFWSILVSFSLLSLALQLHFGQLGTVPLEQLSRQGSVAMRLMMMAGWVSFSLMTIYTNLGEVEDAMNTLTPPHSLTDAEIPRF